MITLDLEQLKERDYQANRICPSALEPPEIATTLSIQLKLQMNKKSPKLGPLIYSVKPCLFCKGVTRSPEMEKVGDTGDISLLFFLAGANFWAILGNFRAIFYNFLHLCPPEIVMYQIHCNATLQISISFEPKLFCKYMKA